MLATQRTERIGEARLLDAAGPAVSWGAIIAGAFIIAAVGFILLALGAGFGLASVSPWQDSGASATTFAIVGAVWLIVVQWLSSGVGGYVAGRLRARWTTLHVDEIYFRDTAHGVLAWAVAAVITTVFLASAASAIISGTAENATTVIAATAQGTAQGAAQSANPAAPSAYLVDTLFRRDRPEGNSDPQEANAEAARILATSIGERDIAPADKAYLVQLVSARTGLSQPDAEKRVNEVVAKVKEAELKVREAADAARKAARNFAFFTAFSMLVGAFIAGVAAKIGGHHRDQFP